MGRLRDVGDTMLHVLMTLNWQFSTVNGIPNTDYFEKLNQLVTYVQEQHVA